MNFETINEAIEYVMENKEQYNISPGLHIYEEQKDIIIDLHLRGRITVEELEDEDFFL